jgi:hypothetical protein
LGSRQFGGIFWRLQIINTCLPAGSLLVKHCCSPAKEQRDKLGGGFAATPLFVIKIKGGK